MTVRDIYSWQYQSTHEKMMGFKETPYGVCFLYGKNLAIWAKKLPTALVLIADSILSKLDQQNAKTGTAKLHQDKVEQSFKILCIS